MRIFPTCLLFATLSAVPAFAQEAPRPLPPPALDAPGGTGTPQTAVLSGGCYWGMQGLFEHVKGVTAVTAGLSGAPQTSNEDDIISRGHKPTEAVQIVFDPRQITYGRLLQIFFSVAHDPTEVDRQGPDVGPQYRSVIYYSDDSQQKIAQAYITQLEAAGAYGAPFATTVEPLKRFRAVDDSQQDYDWQNPKSSYVVNVDDPKFAALKIIFPTLYRDPPLTYSHG
ncbi:MAG: peptide-methionine (S)-S-oxide reductase MsrA [Rhizomicrobium sp.]